MKDIAVYGFGGYGREIASIIKSINTVEPTWNFVGFFDDDITKLGLENEIRTITKLGYRLEI